MLRCYNVVEITQQPTAANQLRTKVISFSFVNRYEVVSTWDAQTDRATVVIPKNVVAKDTEGNPIQLQNLNVNIGGGTSPLFLRGDKITIQAGYWYLDAGGAEQQYVQLLFQGYISRVSSKLEITLECEDNMYLLKQIPMPNQVMTNISMQAILQNALSGTIAETNGITVSTQSASMFKANVGTLKTSNRSVAQFLYDRKCDMQMPAWFKDNELRIWYPTYYDADVQNQTTPYRGNKNPFQFVFQKNIIADNLQYLRTDDIIVSAIATNTYSGDSDPNAAQTKDGQSVTRQGSWRVYVYSDPATQTLKTTVLNPGDAIPEDTEGQRFELSFRDCPTIQELTNRAVSELQKTYYTGFRGSFTTFGMPYIPFGDNVILKDPILPDRDGTYKVKGVTYTGGAGIGIRQEIFLDYKISA